MEDVVSFGGLEMSRWFCNISTSFLTYQNVWIGVSDRGLTGELDMQVNLSFCQCDICDQKKEREGKRKGRKEGVKELV